MTREEANAYFDNLHRVADEVAELMRKNGLTYSETETVLNFVKKSIDIQMSNTKI